MGDYAETWSENVEAITKFIKNYIKAYDVVNFYNYGNYIYKWAYYCKKYNPNIIVYSKLDMGNGGYRHFYENSLSRKIKNKFERFKSQYVDLFSVETSEYYKNLKDNIMFKDRLIYMPNGVEILDKADIDVTKKENIILHVARIGTYQKNTELLVNAISKIDYDILKDWKVYLIGSYTEEFKSYLDKIFTDNPLLRAHIILTGEIRNRKILYSYYSKAKIFILTSRYESWGIAALEALYHKNYLLLSNYGFAVYDITNNQNYGKVISSFDSDVWSDEIKKAMLDTKLLNKVIHAPDFVINKFGYESNVKNLIRTIEKLMQKY